MTAPPAAPTLYEQQLAYFHNRLGVYRQVIGGWPTNLNPGQTAEVRAMWDDDHGHAVALCAARPDDAGPRLILAELLRMGHNIDVPNAAQGANRVLEEVFHRDPDNLAALLCRAQLYVSAFPGLMPDAERLFRQVLARVGSAGDAAAATLPAVLQGLAFACLHQKKTDDALGFLAQYLERVPGDARIAALHARLAAGERGATTVDAAAAAAEPAAPAAGRKPWWRLW